MTKLIAGSDGDYTCKQLVYQDTRFCASMYRKMGDGEVLFLLSGVSEYDFEIRAAYHSLGRGSQPIYRGSSIDRFDHKTAMMNLLRWLSGEMDYGGL